MNLFTYFQNFYCSFNLSNRISSISSSITHWLANQPLCCRIQVLALQAFESIKSTFQTYRNKIAPRFFTSRPLPQKKLLDEIAKKALQLPEINKDPIQKILSTAFELSKTSMLTENPIRLLIESHTCVLTGPNPHDLSSKQKQEVERIFWLTIQQVFKYFPLYTEEPVLEFRYSIQDGERIMIPRPILGRLMNRSDRPSLETLFSTTTLTFADGEVRLIDGFTKALLCLESDYFKTLWYGHFQESQTTQVFINFPSENWDIIFSCFYCIRDNECFRTLKTFMKYSYTIQQKVESTMSKWERKEPLNQNALGRVNEVNESYIDSASLALYSSYVSSQLLAIDREKILDVMSCIGYFNLTQFYNACSGALWQILIESPWSEVESDPNELEDGFISLGQIENFEQIVYLNQFAVQHNFDRLQEQTSELIDHCLRITAKQPELFSQVTKCLKNESTDLCLSKLKAANGYSTDEEDEFTDDHIQQITETGIKIKKIDLSDDYLTENALSYLKNIPGLENLVIKFCTWITDTGFSHLIGLPIKSLELNSCSNLTPESLSYIRQLTQLEILDLSCSDWVTDESLALLAGSPIQSLMLYGGKNLKGVNLHYLSYLPNLTALSLERFSTDNPIALQALANLKIKKLSLRAVELEPQSISYLCSPHLQELRLSFCNWVTDENLTLLQGQNLKVLSLEMSLRSLNSMQFQKHLPNVEELNLNDFCLEPNILKSICLMPKLKTLFLCLSQSIPEQELALLGSAPSLQVVYVNEFLISQETAHKFQQLFNISMIRR